MLNIGCHLSVANGYRKMGEEALSIDANTFQFFSRNPRGSQMRALDEADIGALRDLLTANRFAPILAHAPYTMNPCSADPHLRELAVRMMQEDLARLEYLPGNLYNFHPGSHTGQGIETGLDQIVNVLNQVLKQEHQTTVLLEGMSGKGSEVGSRFEELRAIIDRVEIPEKMGVCLDTCHLYSAGYDVVGDLDGVLETFDRIVGLNRLKAIHLNDSLVPFDSRKDRHAAIGEGTIGTGAILRVISHPLLRQLPFFLETPQEVPGYAAEIRLLREGFRG